MVRCLLLLAFLFLPFPTVRAADDGVAFFESKVRPLLHQRCVGCHGPEKQKGGLRLDSSAALKKGGERGPAVIPGKPDQSLLILAIRHGEELKMPPRDKLSASEIALLTSWVAGGAIWPEVSVVAPTATVPRDRSQVTAEDRAFWAFRPPVISAFPNVKAAWGQSPIDRYVLAGLEARGLSPAPPAARRTLLRRATLDLTGLPPTPDEVDAFLADVRPDAFAHVLDRLLASPHYGVRWGRHWLDVARYADSNGMDENIAMGQAWRYRDMVIQSFNEDKPYDRFVREQIAGDLLEDAGPMGLAATGFLCIGPKMLAEDDPVKMEMDIIDEQLDTVGRTFLGLTLGCARCHDHKYDPIPTADYYSLAGIFKSTRTMDNFKVVARWHERPLGTVEELRRRNEVDKRLAATQGEIDAHVSRENRALLTAAQAQRDAYIAAAQELRRQEKHFQSLVAQSQSALPQGTLLFEAENYDRGNVRKEFQGYGEKIGVIYNAGPLPNVAEYDLTVAASGNYQVEIRYAAAEARPLRLQVDGQVVKTEAAGQVTGSWYPDTQKWSAELVIPLKLGKHTIRLERQGPFPHIDKLALVPTLGAVLVVPRTAEQIATERGLIVDFVKAWASRLEVSRTPEELTALARDPMGPFALPRKPETYYSASAREALKTLKDQMARQEKERPLLPEVMSVEEGTATDLRVHIRGSHLTLAGVVPRGFPRVLVPEGGKPSPLQGSGRLDLAWWLTSPKNPLTARVLVNRIWHWHFGHGLVRSPDNFGRLGERPTHPEMLDWLTVRFVESGWSIKALHRMIMLSDTYQMSADYNDQAAQRDPDNRLRWRWDRRRLEAESLRDSLLAVSGGLDTAMGGTLYPGENRKYVQGYPNTTYDKYDSPRRSAYLPVIRSNVYDVFQAFDFADPSVPNGERATTTVAPQALFLMNSAFVQSRTRQMASILLHDPLVDDTERLRRLYRHALGRQPDPRETARALVHLQRVAALAGAKEDPKTLAWQSLCRALVSTNEFLHID